MRRLSWSFFFFSVLAVQTAFADVHLPKVFGSHMVLQRRRSVPVWGWADPNEKVTVALNGTTKTAKAGKDGKWRVSLDPMEAGGPYQLVVKGKKNSVTFDDVLTGEVWICSGQSNMEFTLQSATNGKPESSTANYPTIRQLLVKKEISLTPKDDIEGDWQVCTPQTAPNFTAVGYFFAQKLQQELNVPIGLINTSWGGTHSETWTSREAMMRDAELSTTVAKMPADFSEVERKAKERMQQLVREKQGTLPTAAEEQTWAETDLNDSQWNTMGLPTHWEFKGGLPDLDGVVWFRREVTIPDGVSLKNARLLMGPIDDRDSTFVNGQFVGTLNQYNEPRTYALPDGLLKPGRNVVAVRVTDTGGGGGIGGQADELKLVADQLNVPLAGNWRYRVAQISSRWAGAGPNAYGTLLFNAMLNPLIPYAIAGTIWYQGESNAGRAYQYRRTFPLMIQDWRQHWGYDFPFLFVQLASFNAANGNSQRGSSWAELREAQTMALKLPQTGMAVASDIGESADIHPKNKRDVGRRLAAEAMRVAYQNNTVSAGPMLDRMTVEGNRVTLTFQNTGGGLVAKDKYGYLRGFEVAGADKQFHYAKAAVQGNTVVVQSDSVAAPVAVRYGWADDNGDVNLYNQENFPAVPFRTDTWRGITEAAKFEN